jgi:hypothetical protein
MKTNVSILLLLPCLLFISCSEQPANEIYPVREAPDFNVIILNNY